MNGWGWLLLGFAVMACCVYAWASKLAEDLERGGQ